eukprot:12398515-Ditylum_brightwellii.AAC.1
MDRTGAPAFLWFFCMLYAVMLLNFTALESLGWITLHQILACSLVRPVDENEINHQASQFGK